MSTPRYKKLRISLPTVSDNAQLLSNKSILDDRIRQDWRWQSVENNLSLIANCWSDPPRAPDSCREHLIHEMIVAG